MMNRIYIETTPPEKNKKTNEYRFFEFLMQKLNLEAEIIGIGGKTNLHLFVNQFKDTTKENFKNLVIIDADGEWNTINWNLAVERQKLETIKTNNGVDFEYFLLPFENSQGDFEILLESIINKDHLRVIECFNSFGNCLENFKIYKSTDQKTKMHAYISSFQKPKNGNWFFDNPEYWDFESKSLDPLKDFLKLHLK